MPLVIVVAALTGCRHKEEIQVYRVAKEGGAELSPGASGDPHAGLPPGALPGELPPGHPSGPAANRVTGDQPEDWEAGRVSSMRQASFLAKGTAGEMADISLVILGGNAGGVLDNVNRWREQLGQPVLDAQGLAQATERLASKAGEAVVVDLEGLAEGADPAVDGRMVAAIVEQPTETWFFKMRGNSELVSAQKEGFLRWVASVELAEGGEAGPQPPVGAIDPKAGLPEGHPPVPGAAPDPGAAPPAAERGPIKWQVPAGWTESAPKPMRLVTFAVAAAAGQGGEVTVVKLSGDGGGTLANLNRWRQQIGLPPIEAEALEGTIGTVQVGGLAMSQAELAGTDGSTVAVWGPRGGETWFFKLSGPAAAVDAERANFTAFLQSIEFVKE